MALLLSFALVFFRRFQRTLSDVMQKARGRGHRHHSDTDGFGQSFPKRYARTYLWLIRQTVIQTGLIGMVQHVHDMRSAHPLWVIEASIFKPSGLQILDALLRMLFHILLGTKSNGPGRAGFYASRLLTYRNTVRAQAALIYLIVLFRHAGYIKRAARNAIATADAVFLIEIHNAIGMLHNGPWRGTSLQTTRVNAVHAAILAY